ncbi:YkoF family thiamine/hydroxymethylpyrimidine-binding protein [Mesorhizobium sp. B2-1-3A]|uniref:YkoF family thiamine/hydroxymethylpyrimidine-binding protein n=1 Tax=Mesorhizobium sp. B2-1-3A TaxID=2589971 RepID=UPI00112621EE|nr:YkoF family thiamine/hydroxymethylpyrimidine-binding protein [Mesorhizobium sp. B2-1-3A]TPM94750.1 HMP/thiamine-binding protein [Mesorhizobium sp. B2-1-3A]
MTDIVQPNSLSGATPIFEGEVGANFSLVPASDRFVPIILDAVAGLSEIEGLTVSTDSISSHLAGTPDIVFGALTTTFVRAAASGAHVVQTVLASRGCPGWEGTFVPVSSAEASTGAVSAAVARFGNPAASGIQVAAQFALLPLAASDYIETIAQTLVFLKAVGLRTTSKDFGTRVDGDAAHVLAAFSTILTHFGNPAGHVVLQATLVANSPSGEAFK